MAAPKGNLYALGNNGGTPNTTGLPSTKDIGKKEYNRIYAQYKRRTCQAYKLKERVSCRIRDSFKKRGLRKRWGIASEYLGIDVDSYKRYLELQFSKKMSWDNYGTIWEIDHIVPISSFNLLDDHQCKQAFNYTNTRPMLKLHNRSKSDNLLEPQLKMLI